MSKSIFQKPVSSPQLGRNGFDMSMRRLFTSPVGMLQPVYTDMCGPGDKYKLRTDGFIRTEAVETSAFSRFKSHIEWFFVPMQQLYRFWNEFYNGTDDVDTSFSESLSGYSLPSCDVNVSISNDITDKSGYFADLSAISSSKIGVTPTTDEFYVPRAYNLVRLWDLLGMGDFNSKSLFHDISAPNSWKFTCNLLYYLAYHRIFYSKYSLNDWFKRDISLFNLDRYAGMVVPYSVANKILSVIHYRPWRKDLFTDLLPSPVFNNKFSSFVSTFPLSSPLHIPSSGIISDNVNLNISNYNSSTFSNQGANLSGSSLSIEAGDLRSLFALDRLLRVTANSGSHYDQQTLAHFGYKVPQGIRDEAYYLGENTIDVSISEVVSTASTDNGSSGVLGAIAGKGFGGNSNGDQITFECPCHGILMAIFSIEPIIDYTSQGIDLPNKYLGFFDFYRPEMDNLGMQPFYYSQIYSGDDVNHFGSSEIQGWTYRWSELKSKYDVVNRGIYDTYRASWSTNLQSIMPSSAYQQNILYSSYRFFILPQYTNNIFAQKFPYYNGGFTVDKSSVSAEDFFSSSFMSSQNIYGSDPFIVSLDFSVFKTSVMSVHSLPKLM